MNSTRTDRLKTGKNSFLMNSKKKIEETMEQENYIKISVEEKRLLKFDEKYIFYDKEFYTRSNPLIVDLQKL